MTEWQDISSAPRDIPIETKVHDEHGERMFQTLIQVCRDPGKTRPMFYTEDMSIYVYYAPTHWRHVEGVK